MSRPSVVSRREKRRGDTTNFKRNHKHGLIGFMHVTSPVQYSTPSLVCTKVLESLWPNSELFLSKLSTFKFVVLGIH